MHINNIRYKIFHNLLNWQIVISATSLSLGPPLTSLILYINHNLLSAVVKNVVSLD